MVDVRLRHTFYEVDHLPEKDRVRYTIHPDARKKNLKRLLLLLLLLLLLSHAVHEQAEELVVRAKANGNKKSKGMKVIEVTEHGKLDF